MRPIALVLILASASCRLHTNNLPDCQGGSRLVNKICVCALGTTWNGQLCQGSPQAGACARGHAQFGNLCFCPDGTTEDAGGSCVALNCGPQNAVVSGNQCVCTAGTKWDAGLSRCLAFTCSGGSVVDGDHCSCAGGRVWDDGQCEIACVAGAVRTDADHCACPDGTVLSDSGCVSPGAQPEVAAAGCNSYGCWQAGGGCNSYGCWQNQGGCNSYGCWQGGGACNSYGCSNNGECNSYGCP